MSQKKRTPFSYTGAITKTRENLVADGDVEGYAPFVVNRALSRHEAYLPSVAVTNFYHGLWPAAQFEYLLYTTSRTYQWMPWVSVTGEASVSAVAKHYGINHKRAAEYWSLLDEQGKELILAQIRGIHVKRRTDDH